MDTACFGPTSSVGPLEFDKDTNERLQSVQLERESKETNQDGGQLGQATRKCRGDSRESRRNPSHPTIAEEPELEEQEEIAMVAEEIDVQRQLSLLRNLLNIERDRNEQRRKNNNVMQHYLQQLQADYLNLQRDLLEALELGHRIKAQKEAQIEALNATVREKDRLVEQQRVNLENLDESKLRAEFKELQAKQEKLFQVEKEQLVGQIETVERNLEQERNNHSQAILQFQSKLDEQLRSHDLEMSKLSNKSSMLESELERLLGEPKNLVIKLLKEEKAKLASQVDELQLVLDESQAKYECLRKRVESLLNEQEQMEQRAGAEMEALLQLNADQRKTISELKMELDDKEEVIQICQFNLQRSEKRAKSLMVALKGKEETYKNLVEQLDSKHELERGNSANEIKALGRKLVELESELDKRQNAMVKLQLDHENQLESIRNDRDQRVSKLSLERQKVEREMQAAEIKLAQAIDERDAKSKCIDQLQRDVAHFREESKRLSIELTKCEAKLFARQQELSKAIQERSISCEKPEIGQQRLSLDLEESRRRSKRLEETIERMRIENEKLCSKLKLSENNLARMSSAISKEQAKYVHDYEIKMQQLSVEKTSFDKNKNKYKRYGYKLKKYCEHLRQVHNHICNPTNCGYSIGPMRPQPVNLTPFKRSPADKDRSSSCLISSDEGEQYCQSDDQKENQDFHTPKHERRKEKFFIKRTGLAPLSPIGLNC